MKWWQNLRKNPLARLGAVLLLIFYTVALFAEFVALYNTVSKPNSYISQQISRLYRYNHNRALPIPTGLP